jgi:hypothetical protein
MPSASYSPRPNHSPPPLVQGPCAGMSCHTCNTFTVWAATSALTAASTRKSAGDLQQRQQQCSGLQSSGAAGRSPLAPKRAYMAAWCFRSCCMEQSPGPSRPRSYSRLRFSIIGASAAFLGCARRTTSAELQHTAVQYWHHHPPPPSAVAGPCHAHAWRACGTASPLWAA